MENAVKAFAFHSPIDLEEARSFDDPTFLRAAAGCVYMAAVFIAPYCAVAALCRVLEKVFRFAFWLKQKRGLERVVIFGYNERCGIC